HHPPLNPRDLLRNRPDILSHQSTPLTQPLTTTSEYSAEATTTSSAGYLKGDLNIVMSDAQVNEEENQEECSAFKKFSPGRWGGWEEWGEGYCS
ncbi:hypothetical protein HK097_001195, partial [Rhizophlyctis rosea]